jgi:hypothetical protein
MNTTTGIQRLMSGLRGNTTMASVLTPQQQRDWRKPGPTRAEAAERRRRRESIEELRLMDLCRDFIGMRLHHADAVRRHAVTTQTEMRFDVEHEAMRRRILRQLADYLAVEVPMVSTAKAHQVRSIVKARTGTRDLHLDALPPAPVKTTYNKRTGVSSVRFADGLTRTYTAVPATHSLWDPTSETWVRP